MTHREKAVAIVQRLKEAGYEAYFAAVDVSWTLWTPMLTRQIWRAHNKGSRRPIAIYPEASIDNSLNCDRVIRYLLNRPGALIRTDGSVAISVGARSGEGVFPVDPDTANAFWQSPDRKLEFHIHYAGEFRLPNLDSVPLYTPIVDESIFFGQVVGPALRFLADRSPG